MNTRSFPHAEENMRYDDTLLQSLQLGQRDSFFRAYEWQVPSITHSYNKPLAEDLVSIDHASRATGGGIVFHSPGDITFSLGAYHHHPDLPQRFKDKIEWVSHHMTQALEHCGVHTTASIHPEGEQTIQFCNGYHNPYERMVNGQKCVAIAMRRFRDVFMMQGVIHMTNNKDFFILDAAYTPYLTEGLKGQLEAKALMLCLEESFSRF
jgi:lipoate-protein ligase A